MLAYICTHYIGINIKTTAHYVLENCWRCRVDSDQNPSSDMKPDLLSGFVRKWSGQTEQRAGSTTRAFESLPGHFYAAGGLSKSIQLQSAGQLSALPPGCLCKVLMHSEAERCSAATHTGHFFRLLTASFKPSKVFLCRKFFFSKAAALKWNYSRVIWVLLMPHSHKQQKDDMCSDKHELNSWG